MAKLPNTNVLVLNKYFTGIHVCSLLRAVSLAYDNKAEIISVTKNGFYPFSFCEWVDAFNFPETLGLDPDGETTIRTGSIEFFAPKVIRLTASNYVASEKRQLRPTRHNVILRDEFTCQYCGKEFTSAKLTIDHVVPKSKGGKSTWQNMVAACWKCNNKKGDKKLSYMNMKLINTPFKPQPIEFLTKKLDKGFLEEYSQVLGIKSNKG